MYSYRSDIWFVLFCNIITYDPIQLCSCRGVVHQDLEGSTHPTMRTPSTPGTTFRICCKFQHPWGCLGRGYIVGTINQIAARWIPLKCSGEQPLFSFCFFSFFFIFLVAPSQWNDIPLRIIRVGRMSTNSCHILVTLTWSLVALHLGFKLLNLFCNLLSILVFSLAL